MAARAEQLRAKEARRPMDVASGVDLSTSKSRQAPNIALFVDAAEEVALQAAVHAASLDHDGAFPIEDIAALRIHGLLAAPLPPSFGGGGLGTMLEGASPLLEVFRRIGHASLPLGRLYEGHVNAVKLIFRYGGPVQKALCAREVIAGQLFGVWNTEVGDGVRLSAAPGDRWLLEGSKVYASGAGHVQRPLITARTSDGSVRMVVPELAAGERADLSGWIAHGMRASATGTLDFSGLEVGSAEIIGEPGDYLRQPIFSAGAWRFAAVHLGGIERLLDELRGHLVSTRRNEDPYQLARVGQPRSPPRLPGCGWIGHAVSPRMRTPTPTPRWPMSTWLAWRWSGQPSTCSNIPIARSGLRASCDRIRSSG